MLTHINVQIGGGGVIGVDIFFVLSGFLITTLLLEERHRWGRLAIGKFYGRRALRLLPALFFMLFAVAVYALLVAHGTRRGDILGEIAESALYVRNLPFWHGAIVMLGHTWSLALEEQFYLIWPWIFLLFGPRRLRSLSWCLTLLIVVGFVHRLVGLGTGHWLAVQRPDALAIGCLVALLRWQGLIPRPSSWTRIAAVVSAAIVAFLVVMNESIIPFLNRGGFTLAAICSAIVILSVTDDARTIGARLLASPPLIAVGKISYALYLWHYPVYFVVREHGSAIPGPVQVFLKLAISLSLAVLSFFVIEKPAARLRGSFRPGPPADRPRLRVAAPVTSD